MCSGYLLSTDNLAIDPKSIENKIGSPFGGPFFRPYMHTYGSDVHTYDVVHF